MNQTLKKPKNIILNSCNGHNVALQLRLHFFLMVSVFQSKMLQCNNVTGFSHTYAHTHTHTHTRIRTHELLHCYIVTYMYNLLIYIYIHVTFFVTSYITVTKIKVI